MRTITPAAALACFSGAAWAGPPCTVPNGAGSYNYDTCGNPAVALSNGGGSSGSGTISQIGTVTLTNTMPVSGTVSILGGGSNAAAGTTGAAVPGSAGYTGFSSGGTLVGVSAANPMPVSATGSVTLTGSLPSGSNTLGAVSITGTPSVLSAGGSVTLTGSLPAGSNTLGAVSVSGTPSINIAGGTATITGTTTLGVPTETYSATQTLSVGSTSGTLFAAGAFVGAVQLSNPSSCAGTVYINMHGGTAVIGGGAPIPPGAYYVFGTPAQPLPSGIAPTAISSSGSCTLAVSGG